MRLHLLAVLLCACVAHHDQCDIVQALIHGSWLGHCLQQAVGPAISASASALPKVVQGSVGLALVYARYGCAGNNGNRI